MIAREDIHSMSLREKLCLMEAVWEELSFEESQIEVPDWHQDLLDTREALVREGKAKFTDWETAKKEINNAIGQ